jgi:bacillithiol system protein YtxJ
MSKLNWIEIKSINQIPKSSNNYILIFKHSPRCIISKMTLFRFENAYDQDVNISYFMYVDVNKMRDLSDEIAFKYSVCHESPQLILLKNEKVLYHTSHSNINFSILKDYII